MTLLEAKDQATKEITNDQYSRFHIVENYAGVLVGYHVLSMIYERVAVLMFEAGAKAQREICADQMDHSENYSINLHSVKNSPLATLNE